VYMEPKTEGGSERTEEESNQKTVVTRVGATFGRGWKRYVCVGARRQHSCRAPTGSDQSNEDYLDRGVYPNPEHSIGECNQIEECIIQVV